MGWWRRLRCSFCGKTDLEVAKLVSGPRVLICDQCVAEAARIMADSDMTASASLTGSDTLIQRIKRRIRPKMWIQWPFHRRAVPGVR